MAASQKLPSAPDFSELRELADDDPTRLTIEKFLKYVEELRREIELKFEE